VSTVKFRHNASIAIAGLVALFGAVPVATIRWYLAPILLVPLAVLVWGWRAGTDAGPDGLSIRALFGARRLPWTRISGFVPTGRRVIAMLDGGGSIILPAVAPADLPRLLAASGRQQPTQDGEPTGTADQQPEPTADQQPEPTAEREPTADRQPSGAPEQRPES
jgi:hypothetical protein